MDHKFSTIIIYPLNILNKNKNHPITYSLFSHYSILSPNSFRKQLKIALERPSAPDPKGYLTPGTPYLPNKETKNNWPTPKRRRQRPLISTTTKHGLAPPLVASRTTYPAISTNPAATQIQLIRKGGLLASANRDRICSNGLCKCHLVKNRDSLT